MQATGRMVLPMIAQIAGAVLNIVLDPIMIFGLFGCPEMGVEGAAIATILGQTVTMIVSLYGVFCG
ncbi:MAG: polysaccharide biosynthesis C-terminal domain-containing protein, partial [Clostridia bacterium]|nr:polysaccharide biosynthesis C-terminal domain-containing protein [Clostridia bacterium]